MKYFRWSEFEVMNMSYEKFTMYLSTIPDTPSIKDDEDEDGESGTAIGSFNLFDFDQK